MIILVWPFIYIFEIISITKKTDTLCNFVMANIVIKNIAQIFFSPILNYILISISISVS